MDVEGYEYFALLGKKQILSQHLVGNMIIEIHPHFLEHHHVSDNDIAHLLYLHGYSVKEISRLKTGQYHLHIISLIIYIVLNTVNQRKLGIRFVS